MSVSTSAALIDLLKESDILSPEDLERAESLIGGEQDTRKAARALVKADLLTRWQASQLLKGSALLSLGKYVLLERLPWGSNHAVFLATHPMMDRKVALNVLDRASSNRADSRESFISDARSIAALDHRHLIHVFDIDEAKERCFLVMEYVDGNSLYDTVKQNGALDVDVAAETIRQIADGLSEAHGKKLVHGGLRPTNVILDEQGDAKVIDLGLSKFDDLSKRPSGKDDSKILGIADFLSPEQAAGQLPTATSDIYSLGCIAYYVLSGEAPFTGGSYTQRLQRHQHDQAPDVRKARKDVPDGLAKIVSKMMAKKSEDRYASAKDVVKAIEQWWSEYGPTIAASKPKPAPAKPPAPSKSALPPVAAAPPPKKNGQAKKVESKTSEADNGFPGINVGKNSEKAKPAAAAAPAPAMAAGAPAKAAPKSAPQKSPAPQQASKRGTPVKAEEKTSPKAAAADSPDVAKKRGVSLPLILGGVGAVVLLLLIGGGGLAAYFIFSRPSDEVVAVDDTNVEVPPAPTTDDEAEPSEEGDGSEEGGEKGTDDPEANGEDPALPPVDGENPDDGSGSEPDDGGPAEPNPPEEEPDSGESDPPDEPEKNDPPKDPPKEPKPPKKDPPKKDPPKKQNPFQSIPVAVDLPPISGEAQAISLAKIQLPEDVACYIDLLGGELFAPKNESRFTLERARNGLADREWELKLDDDGNETLLANLKLEGQDLNLQWTPEAAKNEAAPFLCNCALNLRTADHESYLALRKPTQDKAIVVNLEKPAAKLKVEIPNAPDLSTLFVEITKVEGQEKVNYVPKQELGVSPKDTTIAWLGEPADRLLGFQIDAVMQRDLLLSMNVVIETGDQPAVFNAKALGQLYNQESYLAQQLKPKVAEMAKNRKKFKKELAQMEPRLNLANQNIEKLDKLKEQAGKANGAAIHYRVYRLASDHKIDIVKGSIVPEAAAK